jgi:transcriptional regulator with XRE-family HTH domain
MSSFNEKLYNLRQENNLKQSCVAKALNMRSTTWSNYEVGYRQPSITTLKNIAEYFHVSTDYLIGITTKRYDPKDPNLQEILNIYSSLDSTNKDNLYMYIKDFERSND